MCICCSYIYCYGPLLHDVQMSGTFNDSKEFVDMRLLHSPNETMKTFMEMKKFGNFNIKSFIQNHFDNSTNEFEEWKPTDWNLRPKFINEIKDEKLQLWAIELNSIWKQLGRKIKDDVRLNPERYSIVYVPNPIIVPGGRFREMYYWDSYWIIRGLLLCEMKNTVKGMLINYVSMINTFGHIPNGGRIYYTKRSQPPMMLPMIHSYVEATHDMQFLAENIDMLEKEFTYWITYHTVDIPIKGKDNNTIYTLARYNDSSSGPRPESYW
uniref:Trehalase n=1 Tax=Schizaphis graminum TaxID=13262 RepID=A0A2S2PC56_SCHGA